MFLHAFPYVILPLYGESHIQPVRIPNPHYTKIMNNEKQQFQTGAQQHTYPPQQVQQVVVIQQNNGQNDDLAAGCLGGCLGFWFSPIIGITPLCCFPHARARGIILLAAGLGGISWAIFFFVRYSMWNNLANVAGSFTSSSGSGTLSATRDAYASVATGMLIAAIMFLLIDIVLISVGGYTLNKQSKVGDAEFGNQRQQQNQNQQQFGNQQQNNQHL
jgi:hypothetical protein